MPTKPDPYANIRAEYEQLMKRKAAIESTIARARNELGLINSALTGLAPLLRGGTPQGHQARGTREIITMYFLTLKPGDRIDIDELVEFGNANGWITAASDQHNAMSSRINRFGSPVMRYGRAEYYYKKIPPSAGAG